MLSDNRGSSKRLGSAALQMGQPAQFGSCIRPSFAQSRPSCARRDGIAHSGAAEIQRVAENAPSWPNMATQGRAMVIAAAARGVGNSPRL
jgi:hypothetical protein